MAEGNGEPAGAFTPEQLATLANQLDALGGPVRQVVGTVLRGLLVSAPGVAPHVLLNVVAWQTGNLLAGAIQAELTTHFELRKGFKEAFADGIQKSKMSQPAAGPMPTMAAPFKHLNG